MKKLILPILISFMFINCGPSKYAQLFETKSDNTKTIDNTYIQENELLKVTYNFWLNEGIMYFTIYNKTDKPIYVDWKKSAFIENGNKLNYWEDKEVTKSLSSSSSSHLYSGTSSNSLTSTISSTIASSYKPERITAVPPKSNFTHYQYKILPVKYYPVSKKTEFKTVDLNSSPNKKTKVYEANFSNDSSPIKFRNYLVASNSEDFRTETYIDNEFYVSTIKEMDKQHFAYYKKKENSSFIERDENNKYIVITPYYNSTSFYLIISPKKSVKNRIK